MFSIKSLRLKTLLSALVPMALVLVAMALIVLYEYERVAQDVVEQRDTELARVSAARLSEGLSQYSRILQSVAAEDDIRSMQPARLDSALENAQLPLSVFDAGVVAYDSKGIALWSEPSADEWLGVDFPAPSEFDEACNTLRPVFSDVFQDEISGKDVMLIGVPILGSDGELKGVLAGLSTVKYSLLGSMYAEMLEFKAGRSGYAYLVDGNGRVIYHRYSSQVGGSLADTDPVMRVIQGETGAVLTEDNTGETVISGFAPVPGTGWGLVTQERWDVVMGPIRRYGTLLLGILVGGSVISGALVFFSISQVLRPIRDLTRGAERIAGGDFDHTVVVKTGDEIEALAGQFNAMSVALKESFAELEKRLVERQRAEERIEHLNAVLRAIRNVNQLITQEKDRDRLLQGACDNLIETRGFYNAWGALLDETGELVTTAEAGLGEAFLPLVEQLQRGELTTCAQWALGQSEVVVIKDPLSTCADCPLSAQYSGRGAMTVRLEHEGKVYGLSSVSIPRDLVASEEEQTLFREVAGDIAFALHSIELEEGRQQAEEALKESEEHFRTLMEQSPIGIQIMTPDGRIVQVNDAYEELWGITLEDLSEYNILQDEQAKKIGMMPYIEKAFAGEASSLPEFEYDAKKTVQKGRKPWIRSHIYPVKDENGDIRNVVMMHEDTTARKQAEEELKKYQDQLEELVEERTAELNERMAEVERLNRGMVNLTEDLQTANRSLERTTEKLAEVNQELNDFAYVVSHDLKAPLRGVTQLAGWISDDYADALDTDGQEMVHLLISRTKRMHNLIEGILQYSRIGRVKEKERKVDLNRLVQEAIEMLAPPGNIQVTVEDELPTVVGERTRLGQVFQNLLGNAIKFMDKPEGRVSVGCVDEGPHWLFSVADNGPGIEEKYHARIFQMFQTLVPRDKFESTGVGLALVKKIVEKWGGEIWMESEVDRGSTFYFTLPKKQ